MIFAIVWFLVLSYIAAQIACYDFLFWLATFFIPPLVLVPLIQGCV